MTILQSNPKVSIIIPVYNNSQYLEDCIRSAIFQTYSNIEIILIDDCSTEAEVQSILLKYMHINLIRIYQNERNLGISRTQNIGLSKATGEIIAFLDCDDLLEPHAIELSLIHWTHETMYSFSDRIHIDDQSQEIIRITCNYPRRDIFAEQLDCNMYASHFKMIHRDVFQKAGVYNPDYDSAQDYDFALRAAFHYPRSAFVHVPYFLYKYRIHTGQITSLIMSHQINQALRISGEAKMRRSIQNGVFHKFISFMIISTEGACQTLRCIESIKRTVKIPHEIIIVENGSSSNCVRFFQKKIAGIEGVKIVFSTQNLGISEARKLASSHCKTDSYILALDQDIEATEGWIEELLIRAEESEHIGAVTCRVAFPNHHLFFTGGHEYRAPNRIKFNLSHLGVPTYDLSTMERTNTDWNPANATLYKYGYKVPAGYSYGYDDIAISYGLRKQSKLLVNAPNALLIHHHILLDEERKREEMHILLANLRPERMLRSAAQLLYDHQFILDDPEMYKFNQLDLIQLTDQQIADILHRAYLMYD